ncbi:hypothetical protein PR048_028567 [Dryococelus australis]|uniref:Uncharacterized protein n=1 Tax=Dryococelus australis TaxID=614101 RepID=A0ABQ9GAX8_9NEOP|nr:hypothetical protein PR048_028567 [Dryococelus australis]
MEQWRRNANEWGIGSAPRKPSGQQPRVPHKPTVAERLDCLPPPKAIRVQSPAGGGNGRSLRKPADQRHRPARFPHANIRSDPAGDSTQMIAMVEGEQTNRSATVAPSVLSAGGAQDGPMKSLCNTTPDTTSAGRRDAIVGRRLFPAGVCELGGRDLPASGGSLQSCKYNCGGRRAGLVCRWCVAARVRGSLPQIVIVGYDPGSRPRTCPRNVTFHHSENRAGQCRWSANFPGDFPFPPPLHCSTAPFSPLSTHIGSQDLVIESLPNILTQLNHSCHDIYTGDCILTNITPVIGARVERPNYSTRNPPPTGRKALEFVCQHAPNIKAGCAAGHGLLHGPRTLVSHQGEPGSIPGRVTGFSQVGIVLDNAAGWRVFSGISRFPHPPVPLLLHTLFGFQYLAVRAAQISSLTVLGRRYEDARRWNLQTAVIHLQLISLRSHDSGGSYSEILRAEGVIEVSMEQQRNERVGETGDPRENPPTSDIVRHDSYMRRYGSDPAGVGGEQAKRSATMVPACAKACARYNARSVLQWKLFNRIMPTKSAAGRWLMLPMLQRHMRNACRSLSMNTVLLEEMVRQHINDMPSTSTRSIALQMGVSHSTARDVVWGEFPPSLPLAESTSNAAMLK